MYLNTCPTCGIVYCGKCKEYIKTGEHTSDMAVHLVLNCSFVTMQVNCMHALVAN